jgi:hypothetical protein
MRVFISHSKKDKSLVYNICKILYRAGMRPFIAEFEELGESGGLTSEDLKREMEQSEMVALLLTENVISTKYTRNWVAYEVGLAHGLNKPIWVFEDENKPIKDFPVPHVDYYFLYDPSLREDWKTIEEEFKKWSESPQHGAMPILGLLIGGLLGGPIGALGGLIGGGVIAQQKIEEIRNSPPEGFNKIRVLCPECNSTYVVIAKNETLLNGFLCPVCRKPLKLANP